MKIAPLFSALLLISTLAGPVIAQPAPEPIENPDDNSNDQDDDQPAIEAPAQNQARHTASASSVIGSEQAMSPKLPAKQRVAPPCRDRYGNPC